MFKYILKNGVINVYYIEHKHKFILAIVGVFLFPLLNIMVSHQGIMKLGSLFGFNFYFNYMLSFIVPALLEYAQYSTLKPLAKKVAADIKYSLKDLFDVIFFTILIIAFTFFGMYTIAEGKSELFEYRIAIAISITALFVYMTVYSNLSLAKYFYKSIDQLETHAPELIRADEIALITAMDTYKIALADGLQDKYRGVEIPRKEIPMEISDNRDKANNNQIAASKSEKIQITGFSKQEQETSNDTRNDTRNDIKVTKTTELSILTCPICGKSFKQKNLVHMFCDKNCRMQNFLNNKKGGKK